MKPSFYKQETRYSCVPACLRMVFQTFGLDVSEAELRYACDSTDLGTNALQALDVARRYGFTNTRKYTLTMEELEELANEGHPIVIVNLWPIQQIYERHALIVLAVNATEVSVLDPAQGERLIPRAEFELGWAMREHLAIVIKR